MAPIDFTEIPAEGERWAQFSRDFLQELGFHIETPTYRFQESADDFCAVEQVPGKFNNYSFRWLVGGKNKAATRTAVKETDESDILERVRKAKADGFIGVYSTPISPALENELANLKEKGFLKDFWLFDGKSLEVFLLSPGCTKILTRYFPKAASLQRPIVKLQDDYLPIRCDCCAKDLLETIYAEDQHGVVVRLARRKMSADELDEIVEVYFTCKGECDEKLQRQYCKGTNLGAANWANLADIATPVMLLERIVSIMDILGKGKISYSDQAIEKEEYLVRALAQRVFREPTPGELERAKKHLNGNDNKKS